MTGAPFRAVVFDLDGTLVDTLPDILPALNRLMAEEGRRPITTAEGRRMMGQGSRKLIERACTATGNLPDEGAIERYYNRFIEYYMAAPAERSAPYPGAAAMLQNLSAAGVTLGVCTNKPHEATLRVLDGLALRPYFAAVLGGDALDVRKPDAGHLRAVLAAMGAGSDSAAMVGDSEIDVAAARNAGVPVIVVDFGYSALAPAALGADAVISHLGDLPDALADIAG
jgi:phosphoglycolate phosphatase